jgi:hypothetical protein
VTANEPGAAARTAVEVVGLEICPKANRPKASKNMG